MAGLKENYPECEIWYNLMMALCPIMACLAWLADIQFAEIWTNWDLGCSELFLMGLNNETVCTHFFSLLPIIRTYCSIVKRIRVSKGNLLYSPVNSWIFQISGLAISLQLTKVWPLLFPFLSNHLHFDCTPNKVPGYLAAPVSIQNPFMPSNS